MASFLRLENGDLIKMKLTEKAIPAAHIPISPTRPRDMLRPAYAAALRQQPSFLSSQDRENRSQTRRK
ncbi:MAG: hypothetical protein KF780_07615 [Sphingomonas sp.]|nr:hypothetical protein [Sphingomonas sp.]